MPSVDIDLTLDSEEEDVEMLAPAHKRPKTEASHSDDDVIIIEPAGNHSTEAMDTAALASVNGAGESAEELNDSEELRITGGHVEVWNKDLPHQRHLCGVHVFSAFCAMSNATSCPNCFCFICDSLVKDCSAWGSGLSQGDHCNAHSDRDGFYKALKEQSRAGGPEIPRCLVSRGILREDLLSRYLNAAFEELPPPCPADGMVELGCIRLRCRSDGGSTIKQLDSRLLRNGIYECQWMREPPGTEGKLHISNIFKSQERLSSIHPGYLDLRPLDLLPLGSPTSKPVPRERTVALTVVHCAGSARPAMYGFTVDKETKVKDLVAKAKADLRLEEPFGGFLLGFAVQNKPKTRFTGSQSINVYMQEIACKAVSRHPLVLYVPAPLEPPGISKTMRLSGGQPVRLLVHLRVPAKTGSTDPPSRDQYPEIRTGLPIIFNAYRTVAEGGPAAAKIVMAGICAALRPLRRTGAPAPCSGDIKHLVRCDINGSTQHVFRHADFCEWISPDVQATHVDIVQLAAIMGEGFHTKYSIKCHEQPKVYPCASPEILEASKKREDADAAYEAAKQQAARAPFRVLHEIEHMQKCSKPQKLETRFGREHVEQIHRPALKVQIHLEPDGGSDLATEGTAVLRIWIWTRPPEPLELGRPLHRQFFPDRGVEELLSTIKMMTADVPGIDECFNEMQAWTGAGAEVKTTEALLQRLETGEIEAATQPPGLDVTLRPYQLQTLGFMQRQEKGDGGLCQHLWFPIPLPGKDEVWWWSPVLREASLNKPKPTCWGGFLAETMGLGKTVEVLALILSDRGQVPPVPRQSSTLYPIDHPLRKQAAAPAQQEGPELHEGRVCSNATLVICAVSLVGQWMQEAKSKTNGSLRIYQYHGCNRIRDPAKLAISFDVVVTTYATLASDWTRKDSAGSPLHEVQWYRVVMDESHCLKTASTTQSKACTGIMASRRWCCSGTPIHNDILDLHGQFSVLKMPPFSDKGFFSRYKFAFAHNYHSSQSAQLFYTLSKVLVRHTKHQITGGETVLSLPPLHEDKVEVAFGPEEAALYKQAHAVVSTAFREISSLGASHVAKHYLQITALLLPLRRIASGGVLKTTDITIPEAHRDVAVPKSVEGLIVPAETNCAICLENLERPIRTPCGHWFCHHCMLVALEAIPACPLCRSHVTQEELAAPEAKDVPEAAAVAQAVPCESKLKALVAELIAMRTRDATAKALVFSQFMGTIEWLKERLPQLGFGFRYIDGAMPMMKRAKAIAEFQEDPPTTVFLLSMRAGAVGINLTAASHVFLMEPALNPALEEQAIGRAWRMGQSRSVVVKKFYVKGTVEENIMALTARRASGASSSKKQHETANDSSPSAQVGAGCLHADRQNLKLEEFRLLFSEP